MLIMESGFFKICVFNVMLLFFLREGFGNAAVKQIIQQMERGGVTVIAWNF